MKKLNITFIALAVIAMMVSCSTPKGETVDAKDAEKVATLSAAAINYSIQADQSAVVWTGSKPTGQHTGTIPVNEGSFSVLNEELTGGQFTLDITGLDVTDLEKDSKGYNDLKGHLMSPAFFAADSFPTANFEITTVKVYVADSIEDKAEYETEFAPKKASENMVANPTHSISGNLTMRGITKNITFPANVDMSDGMIKASAKLNIDRTDWNLSYGDESTAVDKAKDKFIYNTVNLDLNIAAAKAAM